MINIEMKKAYLVKRWAEKLEEGYASTKGFTEGFWTAKRVIFTKDFKHICLESIGSIDQGVYFDKDKALRALEREKDSYRKYLERLSKL